MNKLFFRSATATAWLCLSGYLLLAPASSFSENGLLGWLFTMLGLAEWQEQLPIDKLIHWSIFLGLVFLWQRVLMVLPHYKHQQKRWLLLNLALWFSVGIAIEILQETMQVGRQFDYADILCNAMGCLTGGWMAKKLTPVETGVATKTNCL